MITKSVLHTGLQGIQNGMSGMHKAAHEIATAMVPPEPAEASSAGSLAESLVDLQLYEAGTQASARVVKAADQTLGTLLDTTA